MKPFTNCSYTHINCASSLLAMLAVMATATEITEIEGIRGLRNGHETLKYADHCLVCILCISTLTCDRFNCLCGHMTIQALRSIKTVCLIPHRSIKSMGPFIAHRAVLGVLQGDTPLQTPYAFPAWPNCMFPGPAMIMSSVK